MSDLQERDIRRTREEMDQAKARSERDVGGQRLPRRYHLYDKIKDHVSLRTVDLIIVTVSALIILLLIYGIATGTPPA
ncbi:MAG: hypothetical protein IKE24_02040 [Clostridia bacterium]|nr:hypothetical protein [Clostridia bacterium]